MMILMQLKSEARTFVPGELFTGAAHTVFSHCFLNGIKNPSIKVEMEIFWYLTGIQRRLQQFVCALVSRSRVAYSYYVCILLQLPFGSSIDARVGIPYMGLSLCLPAWTHQGHEREIFYFPTVSHGENRNTIIHSFLILLLQHQRQYGCWPSIIKLAMDAKSTGRNYAFVSFAWELVRKWKLAKEVWLLFGEGGHHVMRVEHEHARFTAWMSEQQLIQSLSDLVAKLHDRKYRRTRFEILPITYIHDFIQRYEHCVSEASITTLAIESRRLICVDTEHGVRAWSEPFTRLHYGEDYSQLLQHIENKPAVVSQWFARDPIDVEPPWDVPSRNRSDKQQLIGDTPNMPLLHQLIQTLRDNSGFSSSRPEIECFWRRFGPSAGVTAPKSIDTATGSSCTPVPSLPTRSAVPATPPLQSLEQAVANVRAKDPDVDNKFVKVVYRRTPYLCAIVRHIEGDEYELKELEGPRENQPWQTKLSPALEGNLSCPDGWCRLDARQVVIAFVKLGKISGIDLGCHAK